MSNEDVVRGHEEAMALFKAVECMTFEARRECFGDWYSTANIIKTFSYDEIRHMVDAWKEAKEKEDATIHVRDEVCNINNGIKFVVTVPPYIASNSCCYFSGIRKDGKVYRDEMVNCYKKTGIHVSNLDEYLEV